MLGPEIASVSQGHCVLVRKEILVAEEIQPPPPPPSHSPHYDSGSRVMSCFTLGLRCKCKRLLSSVVDSDALSGRGLCGV